MGKNGPGKKDAGKNGREKKIIDGKNGWLKKGQRKKY